jgi:hypothetical protein
LRASTQSENVADPHPDTGAIPPVLSFLRQTVFFEAPAYKVKQHWHERFNRDAGNIWLRKTMAELFSGKGL